MDYTKKHKSVLLKLEEYQPEHSYAFTIDPADQVQYWGDCERVKKCVNYMKHSLRSPYFSFKLYIEISRTGRIHGHGWIIIHDVPAFVLFDIYEIEKKNSIAIKHIDDDNVWTEYCTKQSHIMSEVMKPCFISRFLPRQSNEMVQTLIDDYDYDNNIIKDDVFKTQRPR